MGYAKSKLRLFSKLFGLTGKPVFNSTMQTPQGDMGTPGDEMTDDERMRDANYKERRRREEDKKKVADDAVG